MPLISAQACAKTILTGEHAVVYGQPALAIPVASLRTRAVCEPLIGLPSGTFEVSAPSLETETKLELLEPTHPIRRSVDVLFSHLGIGSLPTLRLRISSTIPPYSGLGSSASLAVAVIKSLSGFLGASLPLETINDLAYQVEKTNHGNPSGIDNSVITYETPILYQKGQPLQPLEVSGDYGFFLADTGIRKSTAQTVAHVAKIRQADEKGIDAVLKSIGTCSKQAVKALKAGDEVLLAEAMNTNQELLRSLGLSSPEIETLISCALSSGALAAKLTGGGRGGFVLILVQTTGAAEVKQALSLCTAHQIFALTIKGQK